MTSATIPLQCTKHTRWLQAFLDRLDLCLEIGLPSRAARYYVCADLLFHRMECFVVINSTLS